jgi:hypothetical protein
MPDPEDDDTDKKHKRWSSEKEEKTLSRFEQLYAEKEVSLTDVEEVWFSVRSSRNTRDGSIIKLTVSPSL